MASDIETCQSAGKIVTISLGGATGSNQFSSDSQAESFADQIWDLFLGGSSSTRPFGNAVLDGLANLTLFLTALYWANCCRLRYRVDLDIESGTGSSYAAFVNQIRSHAAGASKKSVNKKPLIKLPILTALIRYYVTAAPQCPYPDAALGSVLNAAEFDAVYVQFCESRPLCNAVHFNLTLQSNRQQCLWAEQLRSCAGTVLLLPWISKFTDPINGRIGTSVSGNPLRVSALITF